MLFNVHFSLLLPLSQWSRPFFNIVTKSYFWGVSLRVGLFWASLCYGASQATHWLTPPATSLTRFAIRTMYAESPHGLHIFETFNKTKNGRNNSAVFFVFIDDKYPVYLVCLSVPNCHHKIGIWHTKHSCPQHFV